MDLQIAGKTALVLSSSRGLGLASARALAAEGVRVVLSGRSTGALDAAVAGLRAEGCEAHAVTADLSAPDAPALIHAAATAAVGPIDILVCNTGGPPAKTASQVADADWAAQFDAMVRPVFASAALALPGMRQRGFGRIITIASSGVVQPIPNLAISNTLRSAILAWSKSLAGEVAADGVTVNMVLPGRIHTQRVDELDALAAKREGKSVEQIAEDARRTIPAGRYGRVEEFGAVVAFLAGMPAAYITGSALRVDGGLIRGV
jgi:3-oxoacyl-[acyl-carrier protein] reductase